VGSTKGFSGTRTLRSAPRSEEGGCHFSAGKVLFHLKPVLVESSFLADGLRQQCKLAATEQNARSIVGEATKATSRVAQRLDFGVKAFGHSVGLGSSLAKAPESHHSFDSSSPPRPGSDPDRKAG